MYKYFHAPKSSRANVKVELALRNYSTKTDLKIARGVDASSLLKRLI